MNIPLELEAKIVHADDCRCEQCRMRIDGRLAPLQLAAFESRLEKEFSAAFEKLFRNLLWDGYHTHNSRRSKEGFPDWTLWRDRIIFVELKTETGKTTAAQDTVLEGLRGAGGEVYVWRPSDWPEIVKVLSLPK